MNINERERRALIALSIAAVIFLGYEFWPSSTDTSPTATAVASATMPPELLESRLLKLRSLAAQQPGKANILAQVREELKTREKGLLQADTAPQAQAELVKIIRSIGRSVVPPVEARPSEIGRVTPLGADYGEVTVAVAFEAGIGQIVSMLAAIGSRRLSSRTALRLSDPWCALRCAAAGSAQCTERDECEPSMRTRPRAIPT